MLEVIFTVVFRELVAVRVDDARHAAVEVHLVGVVHQADVVGLLAAVDLGEDEVDVLFILEDYILEELEGKLGELDRLLGVLAHLVARLRVQRPRDAAGKGDDGVGALAAEVLHDVDGLGAHLDDLLAGLQAHLADDTEDVALGRVRRRPHDEVRRGQVVEVQEVVVEHVRVIYHPPESLAVGRQLNFVNRVRCLRACEVVDERSNAADARRDPGDLLHRPAHAELLEAAQLRDLEVRLGYVAGVVQEDGDLAVAFQARDGVDLDFLHNPFSVVGIT